MNKPQISLALLAAALVLGGCASRSDHHARAHATHMSSAPMAPTAAGANAAARLSDADLKFVAVAAGSGMYEVEASRLALTRASDAQVRAYAQMLVNHHTANNNELIALVGTKGHRIAPGLPAPLQQKVQTLSGLQGAAFDREFVRMTGVQDHMAAVQAFQQGRGSVADADLRAYIDKTLPVLQQHLQQARDLAGRMAG